MLPLYPAISLAAITCSVSSVGLVHPVSVETDLLEACTAYSGIFFCCAKAAHHLTTVANGIAELLLAANAFTATKS